MKKMCHKYLNSTAIILNILKDYWLIEVSWIEVRSYFWQPQYQCSWPSSQMSTQGIELIYVIIVK